MNTVLLTRPRAASERLAVELKKLGYDCVIEPLLTITPAQAPAPDLTRIGAVMITSANALDALEQTTGDWGRLLKLPCYCVGTRTAARARQGGFKDVFDAAGDGRALARLVERKINNPSTSILHIAGRDTDSAAADELRRKGYAVTVWPIYVATAASKLSTSTVDALKERRLNAVLVFSARTAETLKALLARHALEACCDSLIAIGMSEAVRTALKPLPWQKREAAAEPTEEAVIKRLQELLPVS